MMRREWWYVIALVVLILVLIVVFRDDVGLAPIKNTKTSYSQEESIPKVPIETGPQVVTINLEETIRKTFNFDDFTNEQKSSADELKEFLISAGKAK